MKDGENSSKARQGEKPRKQNTDFKVRKFRHRFQASGIPNSHLPPFRPWRRPEEAFPPPHPHRHLDHIEPPWEAQLHHLFRPRPFPHLRGTLLSADTPPGGHPRTLEENQVLGSWRAIPRTSARATYRGLSDSCGYSSRDRYQASHDSRTTDRGQLGLQR
ncbi:hypothetical protein AAG906_019213 [Vitis piasezkii]